jgi:phosphoribosylanthranilate isomerase
MSEIKRTRIKICGLKTTEYIDAAVEAGADALGFNLYQPSVRSIQIDALPALARHVPAFVSVVVLFVNPTHAEVRAALDAARIDLLQFHGNEPREFCESFARPYMKAIAVDDGFNLLELRQQYSSASALLLDTPSAGHGGSGKTFNWQLIDTANEHLPRASLRGASAPQLVLSGGLTPANVGDAIRAVKPFAVDVSSGVESSRGEKSTDLIHQFCHAVRAADAT